MFFYLSILQVGAFEVLLFVRLRTSWRWVSCHGEQWEQSILVLRVPWKMVFLPKLCVALKILSSEYQLYACGKILL